MHHDSPPRPQRSGFAQPNLHIIFSSFNLQILALIFFEKRDTVTILNLGESEALCHLKHEVQVVHYFEGGLLGGPLNT